MTALKLEDIKEKLTADIGGKKEKKEEKEEESKINSLPEYTIRTMNDDLAEVGLASLAKEAEAAEGKKKPVTAPIPEIEKRPEPEIREKEIEELEEELEHKKAPLPSTEELVAPVPKNLPIAEVKPPESAPVPTPTAPTPPEMAPITRPHRKFPRILIFILIGIVIVGGVGGFLYWQGTKPEPQPQPQPQPQPILSQSLIFTEQTKTVSLLDEPSFFELLKKEAKHDQTTATFKRMGVLKNEQEFLSLVGVLQGLDAPVPPYSLAELKDNYTLALYSQNGERRLVLITEIRDVDTLKEQLKFWEETMADDLKRFFLDETVEGPATPGFQDNNYKGIAIRYINFPGPGLTIDYAIVNNFFIITTSKDSMYETIDRI
jgi:hypothetical protein